MNKYFFFGLFSRVPYAVLWVKHCSTLADRSAEDVSVKIVSNPELVLGAALPSIVVKDTLDELWHVALTDEADAASTPTGSSQARSKST